jgi:uncharacterized protein
MSGEGRLRRLINRRLSRDVFIGHRNVCPALRVPGVVTRTRVVRVLVRFRAGPTWTSGPPEEQPGWDEHAAFVDTLVAEGTMVMGGPLADYSGSVIVLENLGEDEARAVLTRDPFVLNGVFVLEDVRAWNVYVDELTGSTS